MKVIIQKAALLLSLVLMQGCVTPEEKNIEIPNKPFIAKNTTEPITLYVKVGDAKTYNFYNINQPVNVVFQAPEDAVILNDDGSSQKTKIVKMNSTKLNAEINTIFEIHAKRAMKEEGKIASMLIDNYKINVNIYANVLNKKV